jgi:hypothetical protein
VDDQYADATLPRPAVDPTIPSRARDLLTRRGTILHPAAGGPHPARSDGLLPTHPQRREATVYDAVTGITAALFIAVAGAAPWAIGVLIFQDPAGWQSATGRYALLLAEIIVAVTATVFGTRLARFSQLRADDPSAVAARAYHGRYLTGGDFDPRARVLLRRAQDAINVVHSAEVSRAGLLDEVSVSAALTAQEWEIALALRDQAVLRAKRAGLTGLAPGTPAAELLEQHRHAAQAAEQSVTSRIRALERYAAEVSAADAAYRDWRQHAAVAELSGQHLDMLARTAADEHGIAALRAMTRHARAIQQTIREFGE